MTLPGSHWNWSVLDTAKYNEWKNGFLSTEHSLVMCNTGKYYEKRPIDPHLQPMNQMSIFLLPFHIFFKGSEVSGETIRKTTIYENIQKKLKVTFYKIY